MSSDHVCQHCGHARPALWHQQREIVLAVLRGVPIRQIMKIGGLRRGQVFYALRKYGGQVSGGEFRISDIVLRVYYSVSDEEAAATGARFDGTGWRRAVEQPYAVDTVEEDSK